MDFRQQTNLLLMEIALASREEQSVEEIQHIIETIVSNHLKSAYKSGKRRMRDMLKAASESRSMDSKEKH